MARSIGLAGETGGSPEFETTQWNIVLASAGEGREATEALATLYQAYWYPLYVHARRLGQREHDAKDLVQELFARFLANNYFSHASQRKGRFRTFMLTALKNLIASEWRKEHTQKRGAEIEFVPLDGSNAEDRYRAEGTSNGSLESEFDRVWALTLIELVIRKLRLEWSGREAAFDAIQGVLMGQAIDQEAAARRLGMSAGALRTTIYRLRQRYQQLVRSEVAATVAHQQDVDDEMRVLLNAI